MFLLQTESGLDSNPQTNPKDQGQAGKECLVLTLGYEIEEGSH